MAHGSGLRKPAYALSPTLRHRSPAPAHTWHGARKRFGSARPAVPSPPPSGYDFLSDRHNSADIIIRERYPELLDIVLNGSLAVYQRPADYTERRSDGYEEPKEIFIVGTSHFSSKSAENVRRVIKAIQPDSVVLELCRSRVVGSTSTSRTKGAAQKTRSALRSTLQWLLARLPPLPAPETDMDAAGRVAEEIGAQIVLGDRPIEITLRRVQSALPWQKRLELLMPVTKSEALRGLPGLLLRSFDSKAVADRVLAWLLEAVPELYGPLVHERDLYMAWTLHRSKAVCGNERVVGVVGRLHLPGIMYTLPRCKGLLRFKDLVPDEPDPAQDPGLDLQQLAAATAALLAVTWGVMWALQLPIG